MAEREFRCRINGNLAHLLESEPGFVSFNDTFRRVALAHTEAPLVALPPRQVVVALPDGFEFPLHTNNKTLTLETYFLYAALGAAKAQAHAEIERDQARKVAEFHRHMKEAMEEKHRLVWNKGGVSR